MQEFIQKEKEKEQVKITSRIFGVKQYTTKDGYKIENANLIMEIGEDGWMGIESGTTIFPRINLNPLNELLKNKGEKPLSSGDLITVVGSFDKEVAKTGDDETKFDNNGNPLYYYSIKYITDFKIEKRCERKPVRLIEE